MKKTTKAKATPAAPAPVPAKKKKTKAVSSAKVTSPKVAKAAAAAVAPAPAPQVKKAAAPASVGQPRPAIIKIKAQIDIGFGNSLTIRGLGAGLSWDKGISMNCVNDDLWSITLVGVSGPVSFKFLVNDLSWSDGEDYIAQPGDELVLKPTFE
ncbi:hypothetical protein [Ereboglobus luteus]|uniref:CBM20 domain-containing protein n=1 Tax=Ereboglobus luteus TaxID=1796921 RepID=A0A2U8E5G1_9BACT|nr:hypothetical protein [Ereboglobus luteus]AWI10087.1 hypothetical protein CKA38_13210 [Ereboglobus luteus]